MQCFFVCIEAFRLLATKSVAKPVMRRLRRKKRAGFGAAVVFYEQSEQKKRNRKRKRDSAHDAVSNSEKLSTLQQGTSSTKA